MTRRIAKKVWLAGCTSRPCRHNNDWYLWFHVQAKYTDGSKKPKWAPSERHIEHESARVSRRVRLRRAAGEVPAAE